MRQALALFVTGLLALVVQGALAGIVPDPLFPDLELLVVVAIGLYWRPLPSGFALAVGLGYAADVLSGSLLGQHALLRLFSFAAARLGGRQLNLRGALPLCVFAGALTLAYGIALEGLSAFFASSAAAPASVLGRIVLHALVNAAFAPLVATLVERVCAFTGDDEARRGLRFGTGTGSA